MRHYWRDLILIIIGQTLCAAAGLSMFVVQTTGELKSNVSLVGGATANHAALGKHLWLLAGVTWLWMSCLQAMTVYLLHSRTREFQRRRTAETNQQSLRQTHEVVRARDAIIFALAKLSESRDPETGNHLERITSYCRLLAEAARAHPQFAADITPEFIHLIHLSAALHDIGKVSVEDSILRKPGPLTDGERAEMQQHTIAAAKCLDEIVRRVGSSPLLRMARDIALAHHEHWDGTGYPRMLSGSSIPLAARIVAIADTYDALSSSRVYKAPWPHDQCVEYIQSAAGTKFDPELVEIWLGITDRFAELRQRSAAVDVVQRFEADRARAGAATLHERPQTHAAAVPPREGA